MLPPRRCRTGRGQPMNLSTTSSPQRERAPTLVPPTKMPPLAPLGPSEVLMAGMPLSGMDFVLQKSAAVSRDTCGFG